MYQISVEDFFDAAHFLREYKGKCEALHGHRYKVVVSLQANQLDESGIVYDFIDLKGYLADILNRFDHTCLNDIAPFDTLNPSSENIARIVYEELNSRIIKGQVVISSVEVWETPHNRAIYIP
jgi:6-pyruvoyltetrahydropterin/6-carboxytetrahydropterin synthase